jgi:hypothetical protein
MGADMFLAYSMEFRRNKTKTPNKEMSHEPQIKIRKAGAQHLR